MSGLLLRLAGPLQSWGDNCLFDFRDTSDFPTRSGLIGLLACSLGRPRGECVDDLGRLSFYVRIDRPGVQVVDYQTVGGGLSVAAKIPTSDGRGRPIGKGTIQTWRRYLADAVFVVAVVGPEYVVDIVREALLRPYWQPYLGRRSCPPEQPLLLDCDVDYPISKLRFGVPLARVATDQMTTIPVEFIYPEEMSGAFHREANDVPTRFTTVDRRYGVRSIWRRTEELPAWLGLQQLDEYPNRLTEYVAARLYE